MPGAAPTEKPLGSFAAFPIEGGPMGRVVLTQDDVRLEIGNQPRRYRRNFIEWLNKEGDLPLNKVGVALAFYDLHGDRGVEHFAMRENEYRALKQMLGK
jgi:hypothetical protein